MTNTVSTEALVAALIGVLGVLGGAVIKSVRENRQKLGEVATSLAALNSRLAALESRDAGRETDMRWLLSHVDRADDKRD